mmetsp:Transcript_68902/g.213103  ORF Transcript_68902/g.213103 Transcript_68902/m.213103 type:complete len:266 (-) Transcript_68902:120-917(-)
MVPANLARHVPDGVLPGQHLPLHRHAAIDASGRVHSDSLRVDRDSGERGIGDLQQDLGVAVHAVQEGVLHEAAHGLLLAALLARAVILAGFLRGPAILRGGRGADGPRGGAAPGAVAALPAAAAHALARHEVRRPLVRGLGAGDLRGGSPGAAVPHGPRGLRLWRAAAGGRGVHEAAGGREGAADDERCRPDSPAAPRRRPAAERRWRRPGGGRRRRGRPGRGTSGWTAARSCCWPPRRCRAQASRSSWWWRWRPPSRPAAEPRK